MKILISEKQLNKLRKEVRKYLYINEDEIKQGEYGDPYQYKKVITPNGVKYFYAKKGGQNWIEQKDEIGIGAIEKKIFTKNKEKNTSNNDPSNEKGVLTTKEKGVSANDNNKYDAILIGGLDYRKGDYSLDGQVELLKRGFGGEKKVKGFRYNTPISNINGFLEENPFLPIFMFSAGCIKSYDLSLNKNVDPKKLFVIEPYAASESTKNVVNASISKGIPNKNVFVGDSIYRGKDIVSGASSSNANTHWDALINVGKMKSYLS